MKVGGSPWGEGSEWDRPELQAHSIKQSVSAMIYWCYSPTCNTMYSKYLVPYYILQQIVVNFMELHKLVGTVNFNLRCLTIRPTSK